MLLCCGLSGLSSRHKSRKTSRLDEERLGAIVLGSWRVGGCFCRMAKEEKPMIREISQDVLWSPEDDKALASFLKATLQHTLLEALLHLERADSSDRSVCLTQLAAWGERVQMAEECAQPHAQAEVLRRVLVEEMDLQGDTESYHQPQNSYISRVILRRRGLPISLTVVWMEVGQRAGFRVEGVGMPGHFLVRVGGEKGVFVDAFHGGEILSREECKERFRSLSHGRAFWEERFLDVTPTRNILERILRNLSYAYLKQQEVVPFYRIHRFLWSLTSHEPTALMACMQIAERFGYVEQALEDAELLSQRYPDTKEAQLATHHLTSLYHQKHSMN